MKKELEFHTGALPGHTNPDDEAARSPLNYMQLVIRFKWRLLAGLAAGLILGHVLYVKAGPEYEAVAEILVRRKYAPPLREEEKMLNSGSVPSEHIPLILSPMIANEAIKNGNLTSLPTFQGQPDMTDVVLESLKVKRIGGQDRSQSNVFDLRYTSRNAKDAEIVLDHVIRAYEDYLKSSSIEQSQEVQVLARKAAEAMQSELRVKEREYNDFIQSVPEEFRSALGAMMSTTAQTQTNTSPQDMIHTLGERKNKNRVEMAEIRSRQEAILRAQAAGDSLEALEHMVRRFLNADSKGEELQNKATRINIFQSQIIPLLIKERDMDRAAFGRDWPERQAVRKSIETITQSYRSLGVSLPDVLNGGPDSMVPGTASMVSLYLDELKHQLIELQIKEDQLNLLIGEERNKAKQYAEYQVREHALRAEKASLLEMWTKQVEREKSVSIEKDTNGYRLQRISPVKHELVIKRLVKFYGAGAAICLFLVALTCVMKELADQTIKTVQDVRDVFRQPVLGSVCEFVVPTDLAGPTSGVPHPAIRYLHAPSSREAEMYRTIRTSLFVVSEQAGAKVVMVSSPEPGDGKTTLISNLAVALAQSGKRVLLVDADLRRPAVHHILRLPQGIGLSELLTDKVDFANAVRSTVVNNLSVMTAGSTNTNPAETLSMPAMHQVLAQAREDFDFILIDAPPMLAVSDPSVIARHTDGILLVARVSKSTRSALIRVRQLLDDQGLRLIGEVVNGVPQQGGHEFGYTYYGEYAEPKNHASAYESRQPELVEV